MNIIFLDFDGVVIVGEEYSQHALSLVEDLCRSTCAQIVISSDRRFVPTAAHIGGVLIPDADKSAAEFCESTGFPLEQLLHKDWSTPICGHRFNEIQRWLSRHPEVSSYAILDDVQSLFEGAPEEMLCRLIVTDASIGFSPDNYALAKRLLPTT